MWKEVGEPGGQVTQMKQRRCETLHWSICLINVLWLRMLHATLMVQLSLVRRHRLSCWGQRMTQARHEASRTE